MSEKTMGVHPYVGRGLLAFFGGMALCAISFAVERILIKTAQDHL